MRSVYYRKVHGKMTRPVGGIRRYCRKCKILKIYREAKERADELYNNLKWK